MKNSKSYLYIIFDTKTYSFDFYRNQKQHQYNERQKRIYNLPTDINTGNKQIITHRKRNI